MAHETITQVKRTLWVAKCGCGNRTEHTENIAKEKYFVCCGKWVKFKEVSWTGPKLK